MTPHPRFIVLARAGAFVVHDNMDGDDSPKITRYDNAAHLAAQFNRQSERDAQYEAAKSSDPWGQAQADRAQAVELARQPNQGFAS
jgi:hypothetical protein